MRYLIGKVLVWVLWKLNVSVVTGFKLTSGAQSLNRITFLYGNTACGNIYDKDNKVIRLTPGKFKYEYQNN